MEMNRKLWNLSSVCVIVWGGRNKKRRVKQKSEKDEWSFPRRKKRIDGNGGNEHGEPRPTFTKFSIESVDQPVEIYRSIDRPRDNLLSTNGFDVPLCEIIERVKRIESMDGLIVICIRFYKLIIEEKFLILKIKIYYTKRKKNRSRSPREYFWNEKRRR